MCNTAMTTRERILRAIHHQEADRIPMLDYPWSGTLARWYREGLPKGANWQARSLSDILRLWLSFLFVKFRISLYLSNSFSIVYSLVLQFIIYIILKFKEIFAMPCVRLSVYFSLS